MNLEPVPVEKYLHLNMKLILRFFILLACFLLSNHQYAQSDSLSNRKSVTISLTNEIDTILLDQFSIIPNTFYTIPEIDTTFYEIDFSKSLFFEKQAIDFDQIEVNFRVFPFSLTEENKAIREFEFTLEDSLMQDIYTIFKREDEVFEFGNLDIQGGLGRSLNFGNNQNLVVNSNLNLQLNGKLANDVNVAGVLTDNNLPFQPQGNSRQIRELDQVFLQFSKNDHKITLGDYEQRPPESYFLQYNKRLQGINYNGTFLQDKEWTTDVNVSGAVSRGKYTRNQFVGQEGNQGPYKLFGANNESFIIILAGTERVFIDGVMMERGQDRDYIIDYNVGEIIFTNRRFITNRSRISIEFEYTNQTYNSTFLNAEANYGNDKLNFRFNLYTEQDNKRNANIGDTTINTGSLFNNLGDDVNNFFVDSFREVEFSPDRVLYRIDEDVEMNGIIYDTIFVASAEPTDDLYHVNFTFVGAGNGNYQIQNQLVNGRIYEFVAPINGQMRGSYVPKLRVVPPGKQQLMSLTTEYNISKNQHISLETSLSNRDINTLSPIGNDDNTGFASRLVWTTNYHLSDDSLKNVLSTEVNYELKGNQFRPVERYRPVEFSRDWNLAINQNDSIQEHYGNVIINFKPNQNQNINYSFSTFQQEEFYNGFKHFASYQLNKNGYDIDVSMDYLTAEEINVNSKFSRPSFLLSKEMGFLRGLKIGVNGQENFREFMNENSGVLDSRSIGDRDIRFFIESQDTSKIYMRLAAGKRYDYAPMQDELVELFDANVVEMQGRLNKFANHQLNWNLTYRDLIVKETSLTNDENKISFLGKVNYSGSFFQDILRTGFDYEVGAGQEPRREFSYIKVAPGEGQYTWIDYNENGLQEITEFEIAPFTDQAEFVRVFTASNEYVNANVTRMNQWINLEPAVIWRNETGIKSFLARLSINSTLGLDRKLYEDAEESQFNPYIFDVDEIGLLSAVNRLSNRLIYNKLSNKFRLTYLQENRDGKSQLLSGYEQRVQNQQSLTADIYFKNKMTLQTEFLIGNEEFGSENYTQKNFNFDQYSIKPRLSWVVNNSLRLGIDYNWFQANNLQVFGGENSENNALNFDFNWNKSKKFALQGKINYNDVFFDGESNSAVKFSMLNGLQEGKNILWNLNFEREVAKAVKINLIYDGRKLGDTNPVHTGRARITAIFN